jgi:hypothetical protein
MYATPAWSMQLAWSTLAAQGAADDSCIHTSAPEDVGSIFDRGYGD